MNNARTIVFLIILMGFCVGVVIGYFSTGLMIENQCKKALTSYDEYIGRYCPVPADKDEFFYLTPEVSTWIKNFTT